MPEDTAVNSVSDGTRSFAETVRNRRATRAFLSKPVPKETLFEVLKEAALAPSQCNTQPWSVHIVSGAKLQELSKALLAKHRAREESPDFSYDVKAFDEVSRKLITAYAKSYYESVGIERDDKDGRARIGARNFEFYGAPHVALLFMPVIGDNVRTAGDVGMYGQNLLLSLAARGIGSVAQTALGLHADTIREVLGIPNDMKLLFGISFGYADEESPANKIKTDRLPIEEKVVFHE